MTKENIERAEVGGTSQARWKRPHGNIIETKGMLEMAQPFTTSTNTLVCPIDHPCPPSFKSAHHHGSSARKSLENSIVDHAERPLQRFRGRDHHLSKDKGRIAEAGDLKSIYPSTCSYGQKARASFLAQRRRGLGAYPLSGEESK